MKASVDLHDSHLLPETWRDLEHWVRHSLSIAPELETKLFAAIDRVFARHERLWQLAKHDAMTELTTAFAERLVQVRMEGAMRDRRIGDVTRHFEGVVARLTEKAHGDPKVTLMTVANFRERLEAFLTFERRSRWSVVGMVDIAGFDGYRDRLGHHVANRILQSVATLLQDQVREGDLLARDPGTGGDAEPGGFGGTEFSFMLANLPSCQQGHVVADRFRAAVSRYDWASLDDRLDGQPIRVDVGVVCLKLGRIADRRVTAPDLVTQLIARAATLLSTAKTAPISAAAWARVEFQDGGLADMPDKPAVAGG